MRPWLSGIIVGIVMILLWLGYARFSSTPTPSDSQPGPPSSHVSEPLDTGGSALRGELTRLRIALAHLRTEIDACKNSSAPQPQPLQPLGTWVREEPRPSSQSTPQLDASQESPPEPLLSDAEREQATQRQIEAQITHLAAVFQTEPSDRRWATETGNLIDQKFTGPEVADMDFLDATCRGTLCRIRIKLLSPDQQEDLESLLPSLLGSVLPRYTMTHEGQRDGSLITTIYAARDGYDLPGPD